MKTDYPSSTYCDWKLTWRNNEIELSRFQVTQEPGGVFVNGKGFQVGVQSEGDEVTIVVRPSIGPPPNWFRQLLHKVIWFV